MKRIKFEIIPGKICTIDPNNLMNNDSTGLCIVKVIKLLKYKPFGKSIWSVEDVENNILYEVKENVLSPSGMSIIRHDPNMPIFNDISIDTLNTAINLLSPNDNNLINRLKALKEKIDVSVKNNEV